MKWYPAFNQVLEMSLAGSWVILLVLLARLLLRKAPAKYRCFLWVLVLLRLLCPFTLQSRVSMLPTREQISVSAFESSLTNDVPTAPTTAARYTTLDARTDLEALPPVPQAAPRPNLQQAARNTLRAVWPFGSAALLTGWLLSLRRLRRQLVGAAPLRENIWLSDHIGTAFVLGVFRPRIFLPSSLSTEEQAYILLHEQTHLRRHDPLWKLLGCLALCVHWFNPLVWLALRCADRDMELSCDEAVLAKLGPEIRQAYASSLLRLSAGHIPGVAFGKGGTKSRIVNVLRYQRPKLLISPLAAASVILLACGLLTDPVNALNEPLPDGIYTVTEISSHWLFDSHFNRQPEEIGQFIVQQSELFQLHPDIEATTFCGVMEETELEENTFCDLFDYSTSMKAEEAQALFRENRRIWRAECEYRSHSYLLLLQNDGSFYLLDVNPNTKVNPDETAPRVQWAYLLTRREEALPLTSGEYRVSEFLYDAPMYSFTYTAETAPVYTIRANGLVTVDGSIANSILGIAREITLTEQNFDALFNAPDEVQGKTLSEIRESAKKAWVLESGGELHILILPSDPQEGLLLASGYRRNRDSIRWLFRLTRSRDADPAHKLSEGADFTRQFAEVEREIERRQSERETIEKEIAQMGAQAALLSYRTDGYEAETASAFRARIAPNRDAESGLLEKYAALVQNFPKNETDADFFEITLNAACSEIYAKTFDEDCFFQIPISERRRPAAPLSPEEAKILEADPVYQFNFFATVYVTYTLTDDVTVGVRDNVLRSLQNGLREYVASQTEETLASAETKGLLLKQAETILQQMPHDGMHVSIDTNIETFIQS